MLIAIDGYNFIKQSPELQRLERITLQKAREGLVEQLRQYRRFKGHPIVVVFDGRQEGPLAGHQERSWGIEVVFSKPGEKADDVLKRIAMEKKGGVMVVTSDRDVARFAEQKGATVTGVFDFADRMAMAGYLDVKGTDREPPESSRLIAPAKKGPSRRLSKSRRKARAAVKKL